MKYTIIKSAAGEASEIIAQNSRKDGFAQSVMAIGKEVEALAKKFVKKGYRVDILTNKRKTHYLGYIYVIDEYRKKKLIDEAFEGQFANIRLDINTDLTSKKANAVFVVVGGGGTFQESVTFTLVEQK